MSAASAKAQDKLTVSQQTALNEIFLEAYAKQDAIVWKAALKDGADVNADNGEALEIALQDKTDRRLKELLTIPGIDVNIFNHAPLRSAIKKSPLSVLKSFLMTKSLEMTQKEITEIIFRAIQENKTKMVDFALALPQLDREKFDVYALYREAFKNNNPVILDSALKFILEKNPDFLKYADGQFSDTMTLYEKHGCHESMKFILPQISLDRDSYIINGLQKWRNKEVISMVLAQTKGPNFTYMLQNAIWHRQIEFIKTLLSLPEAASMEADPILGEAFFRIDSCGPDRDGPLKAIGEVLNSPHLNLSNLSQKELTKHTESAFIKGYTHILHKFLSLPGMDGTKIDARVIGKVVFRGEYYYWKLDEALSISGINKFELLLGALERLTPEVPGQKNSDSYKRNIRLYDAIAPHISAGFDFQQAAQIAEDKTKSQRLTNKFLKAAQETHFENGPDAALAGYDKYAQLAKRNAERAPA